MRGTAKQEPRGCPLHNHGERRHIVDRWRHIVGSEWICCCALGVAAAGDQGDNPATICRRTDDFAARHDRQRRRRQVGVLGLVSVGVVDSRAADVDQQLTVFEYGLGHVSESEDLGSTELGDLNGSHE